MANLLSALDYLTRPEKYPAKAVCVVLGDDSFLVGETVKALRRSILSEEDAEFSSTRFDGTSADFRDVLSEVCATPMFGGGRRLVEIESADSFISANRDRLEQYAVSPSSCGVLLLRTLSFPSNTRLFQTVAKNGWIVDCKTASATKIPDWIVSWAKSKRGVRIEKEAAVLMTDLVGSELGLLDQEIARLALFLKENETITSKFVSENVGSWRVQRAWDMLDVALAGNVAEALRQLNLLIASGETPIGIFAQIASTLRRFALTAELVQQAEKNRTRLPLRSALEKAGFKPFVLAKSEIQMKQLGRARSLLLQKLIVQTDLAFKGDSRNDPRLILERFLVQLAHPRLR